MSCSDITKSFGGVTPNKYPF